MLLSLTVLIVLVVAPGCMKAEQHLYVQPDGGADLGFALRMPPPLGPMLSGMIQGQMPEAKDLPAGADFKVTQEGLDTVLAIRLPGDAIPKHDEIFGVKRDTRLLSSTYRLDLDPNKLREMGEALKLSAEAPADPSSARFVQFGGGMPDLGDMGGMMEGLGDLLGGVLGGGEGMPSIPGMDMAEMLTQVEMAIFVHMPGRLTETNGEQVDESTAKWTLDLEALSAGDELPSVKASSEGAIPSTMLDLSKRLNEYHGLDVSPEALGDIVMRGLLPNPEVDANDQGKTPIDTHLIGELVTLTVGLDGTVGSESTSDVMDALGLLTDDPSLSSATKAAKRIPKLRERDLTNLGVKDIARLLTGK